MKRLLIALTIIAAPIGATAQWTPTDQAQQQMLLQQQQQTATQQQMLMEMQQQRLLQQQQMYNNCPQPAYEQRRPFGSFIDSFNAGRRSR
jgi:type II secretory pathway pseudopilin PulG